MEVYCRSEIWHIELIQANFSQFADMFEDLSENIKALETFKTF